MDNKTRLLHIYKYLQRYSNKDNPVRLKMIAQYLEKQDFEVYNRKTFYSDMQTLIKNGFNIEYVPSKQAYYLTPSPLSRVDIQILVDSIAVNKSIDDYYKNEVIDKLLELAYYKDEEYIRNQTKLKLKTNRNTKYVLSLILDALYANLKLYIKVRTKESIINPVKLKIIDNKYNLFYYYDSKDKIYHTRIDNINDIKISDLNFDPKYSQQKIDDIIDSMLDNFTNNDNITITLKVLENQEYDTYKYLYEEFENGVANQENNTFSFVASINDILFSKLAKFGSKIIILSKNKQDESLIESYKNYLKMIVDNY